MQYNRRTTQEITSNFLFNLLLDRGVLPRQDEVDKFLNPTRENEHNPELLDHMEEGFQLLMKHINGSRILLVVDPDVDGFTSSALVYSYLMNELGGCLGCEFTLDYWIPEGKEHGLEVVFKTLKDEKKYDLIILPDSSSNDYEYHEELTKLGYDIFVLDHHEAEQYSTNAVVINNQLSQNYPNKALSGVGVAYKFFEYLESRINDYGDFVGSLRDFGNPSENYLDLVALGQISDVMDMTTLENRWICDYGLSHINNAFFKELVEKQSFSLKLDESPLTQIGVAFYITPLVNALIRIGSQLEKERLFQAFITPYEKVPSTKRGEKGQEEFIVTQAVRNCVNAKARQTRERDKAAELLDIQIMENCLDENKILILNADELDVSTTLTGLCAMGIAAKYKKPVMLGRITPDGKYLKGSMRNKDGSPLKDFKKFITDSGLVSFAEGHANACGYALPVSNIQKLLDYSNEKLANFNFNEGSYDVDFIIKNNSVDLEELITDLCRGSKYWGQANPEPVIAVEGINIDSNSIQVIGSNADTVKFTYGDITYIKFKAKDLIEEFRKFNGKVLVNIVGRGNLNRWGGRTTPQIMIDDIEIKSLEGF